jgi:hypothetical protein
MALIRKGHVWQFWQTMGVCKCSLHGCNTRLSNGRVEPSVAAVLLLGLGSSTICAICRDCDIGTFLARVHVVVDGGVSTQFDGWCQCANLIAYEIDLRSISKVWAGVSASACADSMVWHVATD